MVNAPKAQWEPLRCLRIFGFTPTMTGTLRRSPSPSHRGFAPSLTPSLPPSLPPFRRRGECTEAPPGSCQRNPRERAGLEN